MGWFDSAADSVLNPVLGPLLDMNPTLAILIISVVISLISVVLQKYLTDQKKLKDLKKKMKDLQQNTKAVKDDPKKMMKLQQEMWALQGPMMKESFKPVIWTMIPFLLLFMWLNAHFAFLPIAPSEEFTVTAYTEDVDPLMIRATPELAISTLEANVTDGEASWKMSGSEGLYALEIFTGTDMTVAPAATASVIITEGRDYEPVVQRFKGPVPQVKIGNLPLKPFGSFSLFGWRPGWIWAYIIFSLATSIGFRKLLDVA